ncbi:hypothetical protein CDAR_57851 [Caerostris darwini]|uniref:Uncharacterized protein n=1 Tax=Caerostris darwini TaxID=1538125 RepID=A0AAV4SX77_9ARAC|nr:hypothetical protein CDAR_57851 [Caerostris darwini]
MFSKRTERKVFAQRAPVESIPKSGAVPQTRRPPSISQPPFPLPSTNARANERGKQGRGGRCKRCSVAERGCLFLLDGRQGRGDGNRGAAEQNGERRLMGRPGSLGEQRPIYQDPLSIVRRAC